MFTSAGDLGAVCKGWSHLVQLHRKSYIHKEMKVQSCGNFPSTLIGPVFAKGSQPGTPRERFKVQPRQPEWEWEGCAGPEPDAEAASGRHNAQAPSPAGGS